MLFPTYNLEICALRTGLDIGSRALHLPIRIGTEVVCLECPSAVQTRDDVYDSEWERGRYSRRMETGSVSCPDTRIPLDMYHQVCFGRWGYICNGKDVARDGLNPH